MNLRLSLAALIGFVFSSTAFAYSGQPKSIECTIYDGHVLNFDFNDIPASKIHFDYQQNGKYCGIYGTDRIKIDDGPFVEFGFSLLGCKKVTGGYAVVPTYMDAAFVMPTEKDKTTLYVDLTWEGKKEVKVSVERLDKNDYTIETVNPRTENCTVTAFHP